MIENSYEMLHDSVSKKLWSYDASLFSIQPTAVAIPTSLQDVISLVQYAKQLGLGITARGGGTGTTGGSIGKGLIIDLSKSMRSILDFDTSRLSVTVEAGATLDDVNAFLYPFGRMIGADLSTHDRATIGGMIASNSAGAHSRTWGSMREQVEAVEVVLADGTSRWLQFSEEPDNTRLVDILFSIRDRYQQIILQETPKIQRNAFHIALDELCYPDGINIAKLVSGSQGTLGILTKACLKTVPCTQVHSSFLLSFHSVMEALESAQDLVRKNFYGIELIDRVVVTASNLVNDVTKNLFSHDASAYVLLESSREILESHIPSNLKGLPMLRCLSPEEYASVRQVRQEGLSNLLSFYQGKTPSGFIEDLICPIEEISSFYGEVFQILEKYRCTYAVYGHMGSGCLHIRTFLHVKKETSDRPLISKIMKEVGSLVLKYRGSMSSEHGSGLIRSWMASHLFSEEYRKALDEVKRAFDPLNIMNPGKLFPPYEDYSPHFTDATKSRFSFQRDSTFFVSHREGGLEASVDSCTGNGRCRKGEGLMCPPFQLTRDERDSTRGRARALLERVEITSFTHEGQTSFDRVLDLCVQCKGCIHECPSHINIAKMKEEELWRERKKGASQPLSLRIRAWLTAHAPTILRHIPPIFIPLFASSTNILQSTLSKFFELSSDTLTSLQLQKYQSPKNPSSGTVLLFVDSFSRFFHPRSIQAAAQLLSALGETVLFYDRGCCGRALFSKGYLEEGQNQVLKTLRGIQQFQADLPILFLEPSCWSAVHDEWLDLPEVDKTFVQRIASRSFRIEDFLFSRINQIRSLIQGISPSKKRFFFHEHCHTRGLNTSLNGRNSLQQMRLLLETIPEVSIIFDSRASCCGMAGSFGIEKEHESLSFEMGHRAFSFIPLDAVDGLLASGISCRSQMSRLFPEMPIFHPVEILSDSLKNSPYAKSHHRF